LPFLIFLATEDLDVHPDAGRYLVDSPCLDPSAQLDRRLGLAKVDPRDTAGVGIADVSRSADCRLEIARRADRPPAQVLLRWCLQHGVPIIPKSTHRERIAENARVFDFTLSDEAMAALDALKRTRGTDRALDRTWWR
jgi:Aldo/keto reductase family